jgi:hypothetical protein
MTISLFIDFFNSLARPDHRKRFSLSGSGMDEDPKKEKK